MNLLLVDSTVKDYEVFVNAVNSTTTSVVYFPHTTRQELLAAFNGPFDRIAVVSHTTTFIEREPLLSDSNVELFKTIIETHQVKQIDYLACNALNDPEWNEYFKKIPCVIGASNDLTGNIKYGGDWIMESTSENIEGIYFTQSIDYYKYLLGLSNHTIIVKSGSLYGTGLNTNGQLGLGNNATPITTLTSMNNLTNLPGKTPRYIACGVKHTIVLMTTGELYSTGYNFDGQLGLGNKVSKNTLTSMNNLTNLTGKTPRYIACGTSYTIVLMTTGELYGTGANYSGQLGLGNLYGQITLTSMNNLTNLTGKIPRYIACGDSYTIVLMTTGELYGTGANTHGQLGLGNNTIQTTLTSMNNLTGKTPRYIACGDSYTIVLMTDGSLYGTGLNADGQLGLGNNATPITTLTSMNNLTNLTGKTPRYIACGYKHTIVLMTDGSLYGTGYNKNGELGLGNTTTRITTLTSMNNLTGKTPRYIACKNSCTIVLMTDGSLYGTGLNTDGQLGLGNVNSPINTLTLITNSVDYLTDLMYYDYTLSGTTILSLTPTDLPYYDLFYLSSLSIDKIGDDVLKTAPLSSISFPSQFISIGSNSFIDCINLTSLTFPVGFTAIGNNTFSGCINLTALTFLSSITINTGAFNNCPNLKSVTIPYNATITGAFTSNPVIYKVNGTTLSSVTPTDLLFYDLSALSISSIGIAFNNFTSVSLSLTLPSTVIAIDSTAFTGCTNLVSIQIPSTVTSSGTFLTNIAVYGVTGSTLSTVYPKTKTSYDLSYLTVTSIADNVFQNLTLSSILFPLTLTSIGNNTFQNCTALNNISALYLTSIGNNAFQNCTSLDTMTFPSTLTTIGDYAFENTKIVSVTLQSNVKTVGTGTFSYTRLATVTIQ